jgi:hypothetical protein
MAIVDWPELPVVTSGDPYIDVAGRAGQAVGQSALVAGVDIAVERDEFGFLFHAQHVRSGSRRLHARSVAGGDGDLEQGGIGGGQAAPLVVRVKTHAGWRAS